MNLSAYSPVVKDLLEELRAAKKVTREQQKKIETRNKVIGVREHVYNLKRSRKG